jgi:signal transduction histidine kinase
MLTHDIRTPIGAILGYTELLLDNIKFLQPIRTSALALHGLVTNYLDLSQIEAGTLQVVKEPVVLTDLLRRVGEQYAPEAQRHGLTLHVLLPDTFPLIAGAPVALERVFANLVTNAIKFTPSGGQITVRAERRGGEVVVTVADTGPGIVEGERERIFEKYRTGGGRQGGEGTGLGLFIVKSLVEGHGGRVVVNCPASGGTEFLVSFPVLGS